MKLIKMKLNRCKRLYQMNKRVIKIKSDYFFNISVKKNPINNLRSFIMNNKNKLSN